MRMSFFRRKRRVSKIEGFEEEGRSDRTASRNRAMKRRKLAALSGILCPLVSRSHR